MMAKMIFTNKARTIGISRNIVANELAYVLLWPLEAMKFPVCYEAIRNLYIS